MAYMLAVRLGRANVDAMLDEITPQQWREWCEYLAWEAEHLGGGGGLAR